MVLIGAVVVGGVWGVAFAGRPQPIGGGAGGGDAITAAVMAPGGPAAAEATTGGSSLDVSPDLGGVSRLYVFRFDPLPPLPQLAEAGNAIHLWYGDENGLSRYGGSHHWPMWPSPEQRDLMKAPLEIVIDLPEIQDWRELVPPTEGER